MNVLDMFRLDGKVALVTGGAGILGKSIVAGLAEAGAIVITASRSRSSGEELAHEMEKEGLTVHPMVYDQSDHQSILQLCNEIRQQFDQLDIFVNNAVARPM